tara:strand:- start:740 stop:892 length:153 start_codon:yes stop_codon:yes gene_type:complete
MNPILATTAQQSLLYLLGGALILFGSYFFGRLITFFFPSNPLIIKRKNKD